MGTTARLDLSVWRNDDVYEFQLRVRGLDLTGVAMRAQIRLAPDTPGAPLVDLATVVNGNAEGIRFVGVALESGVPVSDVRIRLNKSTRQGLPYAGEIGDATPLAWALAIGGRTRIVGQVLILAHALDSDAAPSARVPSFGSRGGSHLPGSGATLTIAQDDVASLMIGGADALAPLVASAAASAQQAAQYLADFPDYYQGDKGDPGGNVMSVGTVADFDGITVPAGVDTVSVSGNLVAGDAGAGDLYARRPGATGPLVITDITGAAFELAGLGHDLGLWVDRFGAVPDGTTDSTAAINAAIAFALANGISRVRFRRGVYYCAGQIVIANPGNGQAFLNIIELVGASCPAMIFGTVGTFPLSNTGTIIRSNAQSGSAIGVAAYAGSNFPPFAINQLVVRDLTIRTYDNPKCHGINALSACQLVMENINIDTGVYSVQASKPTNNTWGIRTPARYNGALIHMRNVSISGYWIGSDVNEHTNWVGGQITACRYALEMKGADHSSRLMGLAIQRCTTVVYGNPGQLCRTLMIGFTIEHAGDGPDQHTAQNAWQITTRDVEDEGNAIAGNLSYTVVKGGIGDSPEFFKLGGGRLQCRRIGESAGGGLSVFVAATGSIPSGAMTKVRFTSTDFSEDWAVEVSEGAPFPNLYCLNAGIYTVELPLVFRQNATGARQVVIRKNGQALAVESKGALSSLDTTISGRRVAFSAAKGDKIEVFAFQDSGVGLDLLPVDEANKLVFQRVR